jgi:DNA-binding GntR family transcriptional regulator
MMEPINQLREIGSLITTSSYEGIIRRSVTEHGEIFDAIVASNAESARAAMANHLATFEVDLGETLEQAVVTH